MSITRLEKPGVCEEAGFGSTSDEHCIALYAIRIGPGENGILRLCPKHLRGVLSSQKAEADNQLAGALRAVERAKLGIYSAERDLVLFSQLEQERWNNNE
jgi:hypothetical protein